MPCEDSLLKRICARSNDLQISLGMLAQVAYAVIVRITTTPDHMADVGCASELSSQSTVSNHLQEPPTKPFFHSVSMRASPVRSRDENHRVGILWLHVCVSWTVDLVAFPDGNATERATPSDARFRDAPRLMTIKASTWIAPVDNDC